MMKLGCCRRMIFAGALLLTAGCTSVPPPPDRSAYEPPARRNASQDEEFGPTYGNAASSGPSGGPSGVVRTSAELPVASSPSTAEAAPHASVYQRNAKQVYPPPAPEYVAPKEKKKPAVDLSDLGPEKMFKSVKSGLGFGPDEKIARQAFEEGEALFREKKYEEAAKKFKTAADRWPDSLLEEDALFMLGESYFFCDRYSNAHDTFGGLLKKYDNSRYLDTVVKREFAIGRYWDDMDRKNPQWPTTPNFTDKTRPWFGTFSSAIDAFGRVQMNDPTGPLADDAWMASGNAYFVRGKYEDAAFQYDRIRKEFANSEHQVAAHLLGLKSKQQIYDGYDYDGTPLKDADEIARQTLKQFGRELGDEKDRVMQASKNITEEKATRDFAMGEYYEKKRYYGAARYYYQTVIKEYPLTQTAQKARERHDAIRDLPDVPKNHFRWLTRLLGDPE